MLSRVTNSSTSCQMESSGAGRSSITSASRSTGNDCPSTDIRRSRRRTSTGSRSIRAAATSSIDSGRLSTASPLLAAEINSRRNNGLPPDRATKRESSRSERGASSVAARASSNAASSDSGPSSIRVLIPSGATNPEVMSDRVMHHSQEVAPTAAARWPKRSAEASSMLCASSMMNSPALGNSIARSSITTLASRGRRNSSSRSWDSGVSGTVTPMAKAIRGAQGTSSGARSFSSARNLTAIASSPPSEGRSRRWRRSRRTS